jgi:KaiC/GvpD/RAD55 family RecA-like ATPase
VRAVKTNAPNGGEGRVGRLQRERADVPLHDLELERQFLGSCLIYPELIMQSGVISSDFFSAANETVWSALLHILADGGEVDSISVRGRLHDAGTLAAVGGPDYLLSLTDVIPDPTTDFRRLRRLARQRHLQQIARSITYAGPDDLEELYARFAAAKLDLDSIRVTGPRAPSLADCIPAIAQVGPRLPIGLPTLDAATRGGIPMARFVSIVGAPGASKTNLSTWLGDGWERAGCGVLYVAADESRESIVTRLGQLDGFDRDLLEGLDPGRRNAFQRNARSRALKVIDPFADKIMLEQCEAELVDLAAGRPRVMIVDSLQRVPSSGAAAYESRREQLEYLVELLDQVAKRGTLVIVISEMSRAGYRTGKRDMDISALAAGAETRAIEYASHLQIGLKPVRGERGIIDLEVAKNRLGPDKPEIRLSLDFVSLGFREIEKPLDEEADRERTKANTLRARVLAACVKEECRSGSAIVRAAGIRKRDGTAVIRELVEEGALRRIDGVYRVTAAATSAVPS